MRIKRNKSQESQLAKSMTNAARQRASIDLLTPEEKRKQQRRRREEEERIS